MKWVLGILLLANVVFFAVMRSGVLDDNSAALTQPVMNAEKIKLLRVATSAVPVAPVVVSHEEKSANVCMEWSDFSGKDLQRANDALAALSLGEKLSQRPIEYNSGYWVYIPPPKDKAGIAQKIAQLKARGVEEYFVVQEAGEFQHAISLGIFKTQDAAQKFLESLAAKEVRSAKIGERASKLKATVFVLNGIDESTSEKLNALQKDFPASELKKVACK